MTDESSMRLFRAAARGSLDLALLALQSGADINARDYNNFTALQIARSRNHVQLADALVQLGATNDEEDSDAFSDIHRGRNIPSAKVVSKMRRPLRRNKSESFEAPINAETALTNNFPATVASAMMRTEPVVSVSKPLVSIVFIDVVSFTTMRSVMEPTLLFSLLERVFCTLDALAAWHGVEHIDTFDGCYVAAANYSFAQPADHAVRLARFAAAAVADASVIAIAPLRPDLGPVRLSAGMHCGAVCGSVIGAHGGRKHTLHGDAVNVASRMQSHGAAGAVQCSAAAAALIEEQGGLAQGLQLAAREGAVEVKSLGRMRTFWVADSEAAQAD
jgi:class 3 adenylate cyclase